MRGVDAVQDARQVGGAGLQHALDAAAELGRRHLARVGRAHGGDAVGVHEAALHERQPAVELEAVRVHQALRQAEQREVALREEPLVGEVVDREHAARGGARVRAQVAAAERGMPIVGVQDVRPPRGVERARRELRRDPAEQRESLEVVVPGLAVGPLVGAAVARVEPGRVDDVDLHVLAVGNALRAALEAAEAQHDPRRAERRAELGDLARSRDGLEDGRHAGQQQPHVGPGCGERRRQRADHIGEPTGLDQGEDLGGGVQHAQRRGGGRRHRGGLRRRGVAASRG